MLTEICAELRNYFCKGEDRLFGDFAVSDGKVTPPLPIQEGQYYRIVGSVFNDGVHKSDDILTDEPEFHGAVWLMRIPQDVINLAADIVAWKEANADRIASPYTSESFGGYSYSLGGNADGTTGADWKNVATFAQRMKPYRRIRVL